VPQRPRNRRHRPQKPPAQPPLAPILRALLADAPRADSPEARAYWQTADSVHERRPDYQLWRHHFRRGTRPRRPEPLGQLALAALSSDDPGVAATALQLLSTRPAPELPDDIRQKLAARARQVLDRQSRPAPADPLQKAANWVAAHWVAVLAPDLPPPPLEDLASALAHSDSAWKPGQPVAGVSDQLHQADWLAASPAAWLLSLAAAILAGCRSNQGGDATEGNCAEWMITAWTLCRESRPPQRQPAALEIQILLDLAARLRSEDRVHEAARWQLLAVHSLPPSAPASLLRRARASSWFLAELGVMVPEFLGVNLDQMPHPCEPPHTQGGQTAAAAFDLPDDPAGSAVALEAANNADWEPVRRHSQLLSHPLATLAWIARKAPHHAVKKQHDLLHAAAWLSLRHHCLMSAARLLSAAPGDPASVAALATQVRTVRQHLPYLRAPGDWAALRRLLRSAWSRVPRKDLTEEHHFLVHEQLLDQEPTLRHLLPGPPPDTGLPDLLPALAADPALQKACEHQRHPELWEIASLLKSLPEDAPRAWASLVLAGAPEPARWSLFVQTPDARQWHSGKMPATSAAEPPPELLACLREAASSNSGLLLAVDPDWPGQPDWPAALGLPQQAIQVHPNWELPFRIFRRFTKNT
jgi:hypothetical protein